MVFDLMKKLDVPDAATVVKAGDTINDILEGNNAGCGLVVGVLSGADSEKNLTEAGAYLPADRQTASHSPHFINVLFFFPRVCYTTACSVLVMQQSYLNGMLRCSSRMMHH